MSKNPPSNVPQRAGVKMPVASPVSAKRIRPDFRWIQLPVFGPEGYPEHRRGIVAAAPGLGFVGLRYQYRIGSSLLGGVHEDAEYVVRQLASHDAHAGRATAAHITT